MGGFNLGQFEKFGQCLVTREMGNKGLTTVALCFLLWEEHTFFALDVGV